MRFAILICCSDVKIFDKKELQKKCILSDPKCLTYDPVELCVLHWTISTGSMLGRWAGHYDAAKNQKLLPAIVKQHCSSVNFPHKYWVVALYMETMSIEQKA